MYLIAAKKIFKFSGSPNHPLLGITKVLSEMNEIGDVRAHMDTYGPEQFNKFVDLKIHFRS